MFVTVPASASWSMSVLHCLMRQQYGRIDLTHMHAAEAKTAMCLMQPLQTQPVIKTSMSWMMMNFWRWQQHSLMGREPCPVCAVLIE